MKFEFPIDFSAIKFEWSRVIWPRISGFLNGFQFKLSRAPQWAKFSAILSALVLIALSIFLAIWFLSH